MENAEIRVEDWDSCEREIRQILDQNQTTQNSIFFRGQANAGWKLQTTLERRITEVWSFKKYYHLLIRIKPIIESLSKSRFPELDPTQINNWFENYDLPGFLEDYMPAPELLVYLRHNGFPSPLLDWSTSQYIAYYFAFASATDATDVAIYVYAEKPQRIKTWSSDRPQINVVGPYFTTHRRHYFQKSRYTVCAQFYVGAESNSPEWYFSSHQRIFDQQRVIDATIVGAIKQDMLWKIVVPGRLRHEFIRKLDKYNINAFSLFDNEEGLMESLASREIDIRS